MLTINKEILSFYDIPALAERSVKTVLLIRHSYRESLQNGSLDPGLTPEGWEYAKESGALLKGLKDVCFGASMRARTVQTIEALIEGGSLEKCDINIYPQISDTVLFEEEDGLGNCINNGTISRLLKDYFMTGKAETMIDLFVCHQRLLTFLTQTEFEKKNVILASHDIVAATLLLPLKVYPFSTEDWCGNVQGAALSLDSNGIWTVAYLVPDKMNRKKQALFI